MVIGGVGELDSDGIEVLATVRAIDARGIRWPPVRWGDWNTGRPVFDAVGQGKVDHW